MVGSPNLPEKGIGLVRSSMPIETSSNSFVHRGGDHSQTWRRRNGMESCKGMFANSGSTSTFVRRQPHWEGGGGRQTDYFMKTSSTA